MGFFDHVDHEWLMKFLAHRIADETLLRLIHRFLKAGVLEDGTWRESSTGTPQGGLVSPILGNLYLHHALDLWFETAVRQQCPGKAYMIRYADDFVCCFQYKQDAVRFYQALQKRLKKFALTTAEDKTKIIEFGRFAKQHCDSASKPATFDFLGITHYCGQSYQGKFRVKRRTSRKKFQASLQRMKVWIRENRSRPVAELMHDLTRKLQGYYQYYGITDNGSRLHEFYYHVRWNLFKWLNRRSQRKSFDAAKYALFLDKFPLPAPKIHVNIMAFQMTPIYFCE
jgi:group II intron reverse transcriptase/maturase